MRHGEHADDRRGTSTRLIHAGERRDRGRPPSLTTPIYETSTFVFDSAAEVQAYQRGHATPATCTRRYENPTVVAVEQKLAAVDGAEAALVFSSGRRRRRTRCSTLLQQRRRSGVQRGDLRRHLPPDRGSGCRGSASHGRFVSLEELRDPARVIGPTTRLVWFESPINPTLRCVDMRAGRRRRAAPRA